MLIEGEFSYRSGVLGCEDVDLPAIAAEHGTPCYIYSQKAILSRFAEYRNALDGIPNQVCFAVKANSNLGVLSLLARAGAGFDIVSGGELYRILAAGADPASVVFSGVGKTEEEIRFALDKGIHSFNCESEWELEQISRIAVGLGRTASVAIRVNPDVNAITHPYISTGLREHKFGIDMNEAERIYAQALKLHGIRPEGVSCHIGSQLLDAGPLLEAADKVIALVERLRRQGIGIRFLDLGGGIGVRYRSSDNVIRIDQFISHLRPKIKSLGLTLMLEPGRSIVAEAGILLCRVLLTKQNGQKAFIVVDAGMNDLIRPSLYGAHHEIIPVRESKDQKQIEADIVGPVCETGDFFARHRHISEVQPGDLLAIQTAGAYGFVLSSNYNSRPRACELLVTGSKVQVTRQRETYEDLIRGELVLS
ncbi:MAG: diaminopimelate decarboxylase [Acidobacteriaceae bacterium]|nr:diaminopimelate decarboxylase [Acidobacteriaceae bacterium]